MITAEMCFLKSRPTGLGLNKYHQAIWLKAQTLKPQHLIDPNSVIQMHGQARKSLH